MKLYELNSRCKIKLLTDVTGPPGMRILQAGEEITFYHIDGMYSYCRDKDGHIVHIPAWEEVELVDANSSGED